MKHVSLLGNTATKWPSSQRTLLSPFWPFVKSVAPVTLLLFPGSCTYMWLKIAYHWLKWCGGWHYQLQQLKIAHSFWSQVVFLVYFSPFPSPYHFKFSSKEITPPSLQSCLWLLSSFGLFSPLLPSHFTNLLLVSSLQFPSHSALCLFWSTILYSSMEYIYFLMCISPSVCLWGSLFKLSGLFQIPLKSRCVMVT